jgi:hypothetical protein
VKNCLFSIKKIVNYLKTKKKKAESELPRYGFVAMGSTDENWGWLSTHFLNRTASWEFEFAEPPSRKRLPANGQVDDIRAFLDHPKLIMLMVNQHHNVSHPKVVSIPRGMLYHSAKEIWHQGHHALSAGWKIDHLIMSASSNWGPRPYIIQCVKKKMGTLRNM